MVNAIELIDAAIADLEAKLHLAPGESLPKFHYHPSSRNINERNATNALDLIEAATVDLEAKLKLSPGESLPRFIQGNDKIKGNKEAKIKKPKAAPQPAHTKAAPLDAAAAAALPAICKLEFKVGQIVKVWPHPDADKLYCEEIDVGEEKLRSIASGLRHHFTTEQMLGQKVLVVANLKTKSLVGFPSHGMVLCATEMVESGETPAERIEFVQPPVDAAVGEVITYEGLPPPQPFTPAQVEKKKVFAACMDGMKTTAEGLAAWNGHVFMTSAGPCRTATIQGGSMR